ncbi:Retinitis pigmentosa 9-like protein [Oryzias melastigma]|uniref:Retinitis pigmentosa 9-like protein n=1 Tax=Oryzias melastigma TaxID=30732 RepID=A0A834CLF3_ORYME|nr:Retinitis pigmentosa 9-like protein [Oryzias melastigma]
MSERKRKSEKGERREHKKHKDSKHDLETLKTQTKKLTQEVQKLKHIETFYEKPPPGFIKEHEEKPEDCIPAEPGNEEARSFLANAPTRGLWMPLGKEVKVMQCWRCKRYGHRTGDKECPFFIKGNQKLEQFRVAHEDPMYDLIRENKRNEKETRIQQLQQLLQDTTSSSDSDSSSSSSSSEPPPKQKEEKEGQEEER